MEVKCIENKVDVLPKRLRRFAFGQDQDGVADITPGKLYHVYGVRHFMGATFYLVLTDTIRQDLPWWIPARFYDDPAGALPDSWTRQRRGFFKVDEILAPPAYYGAENEIEDKTKKGYAAFAAMKERS